MRGLLTGAAGLLAVLALQPTAAAAHGTEVSRGVPHYSRANSGHHQQGSGGSASLLSSRGGLVETSPAVYISYWGPEWGSGFTTGGVPSSAAQTYLDTFFAGVGGSSWSNSVTQYCQGVTAGTVTCPSTATRISNPAGQLKGTWSDTTPVPQTPSNSDIAAAAVRLERHFGYSANATYFVLTPSGKSAVGFGTSWCAWHSAMSTSVGPLAYAYLPYIPDAGSACGMHFVNRANGPLWQGYFDGFSIVGGHEYAEAITDPSASAGWIDANGLENGDKCAWNPASTNITLGSNYFAVQPLWSNASNSGAGACVTAY